MPSLTSSTQRPPDTYLIEGMLAASGLRHCVLKYSEKTLYVRVGDVATWIEREHANDPQRAMETILRCLTR